MATKKTSKPPQQPLINNDGQASDSKYLVDLKIERPEPMLAGAKKVLDSAIAFVVSDADSYTYAANTRAEIRAQWNSMEARRKKMKQPALDAGKEVDDLFNPPLKLLNEAAEVISTLLTQYDQKQRQIALQKQKEAEEEAKRAREQAAREAEERRQHTAMCMSEIQGIQQQVIIAQRGRLGVRAGGTLECIRDTLAETEKWELSKEHFGDLYDAALSAKQTAVAAIKALESQFLANQEQERIRNEQEKARAEGDAAKLEQAQRDAAAERAKAVEAKKAQLRAEAAQRASQAAIDQAAAESAAKTEQLEHTAATTVAPTIKANLVHVNGLQRPKTWKWRLLDKSKLKSEFTIVDEKSINKLVVAAHERAHEMVGVGAIEIYQEEGLRQG